MIQAVNNNNTEITANDVAEYLKNHEDFFQQYPDILLMMKLGEQPEGSISLVERQMKGLRQRNREFEEELQQVIRNAQDNQHLLQQTISLTINLIPCDNLDDLTTTLLQQMDDLFEIKFSKLLLDATVFEGKSDLAVDMAPIRKVLGDNFPKQQPVCGRLKSADKQALFDEKTNVNSAAILPLGDKGQLGILVLGSEDSTHFDPEMGDLFLLLIADLLSRLLNRFA